MLWSSALLVIVYAYWGTPAAHGFWLRDGALADYRHSGIKNLSVFLLQDVQGAVFFHPFLSAMIGIACGATTAALALIASNLRCRLATQLH